MIGSLRRYVIRGFAVFAGALLLSGCLSYFLGENFVSVSLYNPATHERVECGPGPQRGEPSRKQLADLDACVSEHEAKGFRPWQNGDGMPPPQSH